MNIIYLAIIKAASFKIFLIVNPQKRNFWLEYLANFAQKASFLIFSVKSDM